MKIITALSLCAFNFFLLAQCPDCGDKDIRTNPDSPYNCERPAFTNTFFDWRADHYNVSSNKILPGTSSSSFPLRPGKV